MSGSDTLSLGGEFPPATREAWLKLVDGVLKGGSFERLKGKTADGIAIEPLYPRAPDAKPIAGRPATMPWQVMQRIEHPDPAAAGFPAGNDAGAAAPMSRDADWQATPSPAPTQEPAVGAPDDASGWQSSPSPPAPQPDAEPGLKPFAPASEAPTSVRSFS